MDTGRLNMTDGNTPQPERYTMGTFTRSMTTASGTQAITGVGFKPSLVWFNATGNASELSWGWDMQTARMIIYDNQNSVVNTWGKPIVYSIFMEVVGGGTSYEGEILTFDTDGFTIDWFRTGTPTGTIDVNYIAFK